MSGGKRTFTIHNAYHVDGCPTKFSHKDYSGRYEKRTPRHAAQNALSQLCRLKRIKGQCTLYIELRETTQDSKHKHYAYHVKRVRLAKPFVDSRGIAHHYITRAKKVRIPTEKCPKSHKSSGPMKSHKGRSSSSSHKSHKGMSHRSHKSTKKSSHSKKTKKN